VCPPEKGGGVACASPPATRRAQGDSAAHPAPLVVDDALASPPPRSLSERPKRTVRRRLFPAGTLQVRGWIAVVLLVALAACRREKPLTSNLNVENKVAVRSVTLYFESPDMLLAPERRDVALPENPAGAVPVVIRELLKGSANAAVPRLLPADTILRAAYLLPDGTVLVDLGGPTLSAGWGTGTHQELMAIYSVVQTVVANFPEARRVRFLLNGTPTETLGGHVALGRSLAPMPSLVPKSR